MKDLRRVMDINVIGYFLCAREAVRRMSTRHGGQGGAIVNVSSRAAALGGANEWVHYAASKGATDTLTIGQAGEVAEAILYLLSDAASYITGVCLDVGGGR
jgi:NAD(P)-dependent dehydrogenase (short-subunit alcohol dehydrogenase family)